MQPDDRKAFETILAEIFAAIDKPLGDVKTDAFWKGLQNLSILEFARCRDHILAGLERGSVPKSFSVGSIWEVRRELRASAPKPPKQADWRGDGWDVMANTHLWRYVTHQLMDVRGQPWGAPHSLELAEATRIAVAYKNAWAQDMREWRDPDPETGELKPPPREYQRRAWADCMARAEADIAALAHLRRTAITQRGTTTWKESLA